MRRSDLYIVYDRAATSALPSVNDAISRLSDLCRADPLSLEQFDCGSRRAQLIGFGDGQISASDWNPLSVGRLPVVKPASVAGLLTDAIRSVLEARLAYESGGPDLLVFASSRSFEGVTPWLHSLSQFRWGWNSIYLLDAGAEQEARALLESLCHKDGDGRFVDAEEFRGLSGDIRSTIDFGWMIEAPLKEPVVPPKGSVWIAREGVQVANGITAEAVRFLLRERVFRPTDRYWTHGMGAWGVLADLG